MNLLSISYSRLSMFNWAASSESIYLLNFINLFGKTVSEEMAKLQIMLTMTFIESRVQWTTGCGLCLLP